MSKPCTCPLCGTQNARTTARIEADALAEAWRARFGLDIADELRGVQTFDVMACGACGLGFVVPPAAGSGAFYAALQDTPWYYMHDKWEHRRALEDIPRGARVLEVGAGSGHFVEMAAGAGLDAEGIELNERAARQARDRGADVRVADLADAQPGAWDAVCAFQVLEHVPRPGEFLRLMRRAVRPGGLLVVSVPNMASFLRHAPLDPLNMPPHHLTHWRPETFETLADNLDLEIVRLKCETLAPHHVDWFLSVQCARLPRVPLLRGGARRLLSATLGPVLRNTALRRLILGHTLYGAFRRPNRQA